VTKLTVKQYHDMNDAVITRPT